MTTRLLLTGLLLFSTALRAGTCRVELTGLPFTVPSALLRNLQVGNLYVPATFEDSRIPLWVRAHLGAGGKRLRPIMVYLSAMAHERTPHSVRELAAIAELIHLGSLALDDFIDKAKTRRGIQTLHEAHGEIAGVVTGPWMQAYVFRKLAMTSNRDVTVNVAETLMRMGDAEILQARLKERAKTNGTYTRREYRRVALGKTGHLFGLALSMNSLHFGDAPEIARKWAQLGHQIGMAYQIKDDFEDALEETGEINYAHLLRAVRFGGSPFDEMQPAQLQAIRSDYLAMIAASREKMNATLSSLRDSVPKPLSENQIAAFDTLADMVVELSKP